MQTVGRTSSPWSQCGFWHHRPWCTSVQITTSFSHYWYTLQWLKSYLSQRSQTVMVGGDESEEIELNWGVPKGSVLGPILFTLYMHQGRYRQGIQHFYADDSRLYISFSPTSDSKRTLKPLERNGYFLTYLNSMPIKRR